ncbi:MAG: hypothetical protein A2Z27_06230 [candidate division Zixibacteria bacterium RBG_16_50_21]|nr:MAG: hypothetical protein A2Z27_06230 [candidate division Zixibacteria bacterium RBG_16_50_21]
MLILVIVLSATAWGDKPQINVLRVEEHFQLKGIVSTYGKYQSMLLPGVSAYLFYEDKLVDSTRLDTTGQFAFNKLREGVYDIAWAGNMYFPEKVCQIVADTTQMIYPSVELQNLQEKYPDSSWRPGRYLHVTFRPGLNEDEVLRHLDRDYDLEILPFNNNSLLRPVLKPDGTELYKATVLLPEKEEELKWANRLVLDPYIYNVEPDLLLPFPPAIKTNQKPRAGRK